MMRRKFLFKIFLFIFLSSLLSILLLTSIIYYRVREDNYHMAYEQARNIQTGFRDVFQQLIADYEKTALLWTQNEQLREMVLEGNLQPQDEIYNSIYTSLSLKEFKAEVTILDRDHTIFIATDKRIANNYETTPDQWGIFWKVQESLSHSDSLTYVPQKTPSFSASIALSLAVPIMNENEVSGYIIMDFPHQVFNEMYRSSAVPYHIDLILSDANFFSFYDSRDTLQKNDFLPEFFQSDTDDVPNVISEKRTENELLLYQDIPDYKLKIFSVIPFEPFVNLATELVRSLGLIIAILFVVSAIVSYLLALSLYRPIDVIMKNMSKVEKGDLHATFPVSANDEIATIAEQFNNMMSTIRSLIKNNEEKQQAIHAAELKALQSQMKPHFLYNVLNSIKFMAKLNNVPTIADMVTHLASLLRSNISIEKEIESIRDSILLVESYLKIQSYRYEDDLEYEIYVEDAVGEYLIPKLIIQPIIENAIEHGIEEIDSKGKVFVSIIQINNSCLMVIEDNGKGIDPEIAFRFKNAEWQKQIKAEGNGIGLKNIYERLTYYYGDHFQMKILNTGGTSVIIEIPYKEMLN